ncbi:HutD family protein [Rhabdaerophilum sp.]|uniref:HutD/Ves family protein n=1 Tax=Rhabdaerophilum sp. TaxID=2717341 RepID=UPI0038D4B13F
MRLLKASERAARPWKNGGGVTFDVASFPENATLDSFAWRISIAEVATDGPFSRFEGIDRSTAILAGEGFRLTFGDGRVENLRLDAPAFAYPGDIATDCILLGGPVRDLNVMTRRGVYRHRLRLVSGDCVVECEAVLVCPRGAARITTAGRATITLHENDAVVLSSQRFHGDEPVWLVELIPV